MSDSNDHARTDEAAHEAHEAHEGHEGPIKTPKQLAWAVLASFLVPIFVIVMLVNYVDVSTRTGAGTDSQGPQAVAQRLQAVGKVELRDASNPALLRSADQVYKAQCAACHDAGLAGAPKFGDVAAWGARNKTGLAAMLNSVLKGKGAMAAQGGGDFSDLEIARAVAMMANKAGGKFDEPQAPAAPASAAR